ncbi:hypothetical protein BAUCODRAFT_125560 [Baudoinia panamericana UAMH 10762]|uniref:Topoisomerase 1-associated factor 1 n=1 Tax=Baudoinia panamericana (strain UAMH 10762) TaxID=717646 RepID=M2LEY1_BAUPA|nr:uncharacterized protein BAUCODRAFT_125560 [Baudoinia panamericana UAMH 10762]EMC92572.1 hypothetical protein BAUCODRAFT_125560 [Baudoinia panamericana UAMH 10762]
MELWEKSETVDPEVRAYVYSLVNVVGGSSAYDDTYSIGDDALAALNDILRWLRLYDEKLNRYDVKRCLAEANLVQGDLLEILALWPETATDNKLRGKLALACIQLLVPLTWPLDLEDEKATVNHHRHLPYLQLAQVGYKRAVLHYEHAAILRTAVRVALPSMTQPRRERSKRDEGIIKLVMYLFRNVAMITQPQMLPSQGDENEISRSSTIDVFHEQDVLNLLLTIGSGASDDFQDEDVVLLEILFHLLKGIDPKKLFMHDEQVQHHEADELRMLMQKERDMHKSYRKHAPSRHNRFGTMLWVKRGDEKLSTVTGQTSITNGDATLQIMDASKKWNKPKHHGKHAGLEELRQADFCQRIDLTETARKHLRSFVEDFLDSGFNPLFSGLRKAIASEADRISPTHQRHYFYLISWFLAAERARRTATTFTPPPTSAGEESTYAYIAAVLDDHTFALISRSMQRYLDEKSWLDLHTTLLAFTSILLTVHDMSESPDEEDQEIAENIQNRIFYHEATHDRIVQILRSYNNQGLPYLDAVTECVHVFVRMLERYSKQNAELQIQSKRRARKKARKAGVMPNEDDQEADNEDAREAQLTATERRFDFARFSSKLLTQPCLNTFLALLQYHADLTPEQLKRCHRYLYRLAFKHDLAILLFRVDILLLLHKLVKGPGGLSTESPAFQDWDTLVRQVFRRCVRWMEKETEGEGWKEMCVVEMLFSKIPASVYYLQNGIERTVERRAPRPPAQLGFKAGVSEVMKVPVAVTLLLEQGKADAVQWVKKEMERAVQERTAWEDINSAVDEGAGTERPPPPPIFLIPDTEERKTQLFKDKHLRLLLATLGLERLGASDDVDGTWLFPAELSTQRLREGVEAIAKTEFDPPTGFGEEGRAAADMVRNLSSSAVAVVRRTANTYSDDDSASSGDEAEALFPPNLRSPRQKDDERVPKRRRLTKRNRTELTEAEVDAKAAERSKKEQERQGKIKSALYVTKSDDESDSEADAEFFRLEEERRKATKGVINGALTRETEKKKKKTTGGEAMGKRKRAVDEESGNEDESGIGEEDESRMREGDAEAEMVLKKKRKTLPFEEESDSDASNVDMDVGDAVGDEDVITKLSKRRAVTESSSEAEDVSEDDAEGEEKEETFSTSPTAAEKTTGPRALAEVNGNVAAGLRHGGRTIGLGDKERNTLDQDEEDEDDVPVTKPLRSSIRGRIVIADDEDSD